MERPDDPLAGAPVLVTGAGGFLGAHLCRELAARGARVATASGRDGTAAVPPDTRFVFHAAAATRRDAPMADLRRGNIELTARLLDAASRLRELRRFVHVGTCGEYSSGPSPLREDGPCEPADAYSQTKLEGTRLVLTAARGGLPATVCRPFLMYGPEQRTDDPSLLLPSLFRAIIEGVALDLSPGDQRRDIVFVEDVAAALCALAESDAARGLVVNVGSGVPRAIREIAAAIAAAAGIAGLPPNLRFGARPYRQGEPMEFYADVTRQVAIVGFAERTPFAQAIARTLRWYRERDGTG